MTHLINGQWLDGDAEILTKADPVSGETLWQGHAASAAQVTAACEAARDAFPAWARRPLAERQAIVEKFAAGLEAHKTALAETIARETGKPRWEALTEVGAMINKIGFSVKAYHSRTGEQHEGESSCATARMGCWPCLVPITSRDICQTAILFRRCWRATVWYLNPAN